MPQHVLTAAREDRWGALWELLLTTGMRPAEALGLKWTDVQDGEIVVQRSLVRLNDGSWHLKEPKTPRARRTIPISENLARTLRTHRGAQARERLEAGEYVVRRALEYTPRDNTGILLEALGMQPDDYYRFISMAYGDRGEDRESREGLLGRVRSKERERLAELESILLADEPHLRNDPCP